MEAAPRTPVGRTPVAGFVATAAMSMIALAVATTVARPLLGASAAFPVVACVVFAAALGPMAAGLRRHHPFDRFGPANTVTVVRVALVAMLAGLVPEGPGSTAAWWGVAVTVLLAALDGVDGRLARRSRLFSVFGARLDMETDALLILVLSMLVWHFGKAGPWVLGCGLMRYAFVAAGWVLPWLAAPLSPTDRGRAVAVTQYFGLAVAMAPVVPQPWSALAAAFTLAVLAWSFGLDVGRLWQKRAR